MMFYLKSQGLWKVIREGEKAGKQQLMTRAKTAELAAECSKVTVTAEEDEKVLGLICMSVETSQLRIIRACDTAWEAWGLLKASCEATVSSHAHGLRMKLHGLKLTSSSRLSTHAEKFQEIVYELESCGQNISEADLVSYWLLSLPEKFNALVTALNVKDGERKLAVVIRESLDFAERPGVKEQERVFVANGGKDGKRRKDISKVKCFNCQEMGHYANKCPKRGQ
jgi:hypothetical protein